MTTHIDMAGGDMRTGGNLTFCSWNVNGINEPVKRGKVLSHFRQIQADVIFFTGDTSEK